MFVLQQSNFKFVDVIRFQVDAMDRLRVGLAAVVAHLKLARGHEHHVRTVSETDDLDRPAGAVYTRGLDGLKTLRKLSWFRVRSGKRRSLGRSPRQFRGSSGNQILIG